ncbi:hypothetical protein GGF32_007403 [Allomyces javanicus]|nr:hypothetical protein GGF32_007403 [Allomyces javanicus]
MSNTLTSSSGSTRSRSSSSASGTGAWTSDDVASWIRALQLPVPIESKLLAHVHDHNIDGTRLVGVASADLVAAASLPRVWADVVVAHVRTLRLSRAAAPMDETTALHLSLLADLVDGLDAVRDAVVAAAVDEVDAKLRAVEAAVVAKMDARLADAARVVRHEVETGMRTVAQSRDEVKEYAGGQSERLARAAFGRKNWSDEVYFAYTIIPDAPPELEQVLYFMTGGHWGSGIPHSKLIRTPPRTVRLFMIDSDVVKLAWLPCQAWFTSLKIRIFLLSSSLADILVAGFAAISWAL